MKEAPGFWGIGPTRRQDGGATTLSQFLFYNCDEIQWLRQHTKKACLGTYSPRGLESMMAEEQLRAHILIHKQGTERAHWEWPTSSKTSKPTPWYTSSNKATTVPSQMVSKWKQALKPMSRWHHSHPNHREHLSFSTTKVCCRSWRNMKTQKVNEVLTCHCVLILKCGGIKTEWTNLQFPSFPNKHFWEWQPQRILLW